MDINNITLVYECTEHDGQHRQPLADIVSVGTLICPECGEDMELVDTRTAWEERETDTYVTDLTDLDVVWAGDEYIDVTVHHDERPDDMTSVLASVTLTIEDAKKFAVRLDAEIEAGEGQPVNRTVLQILAADLEDQAAQWGDEDGVGDAQRATAKTLRDVDGTDAGGELVHDLLEFLVERTH